MIEPLERGFLRAQIDVACAAFVTLSNDLDAALGEAFNDEIDLVVTSEPLVVACIPDDFVAQTSDLVTQDTDDILKRTLPK